MRQVSFQFMRVGGEGGGGGDVEHNVRFPHYRKCFHSLGTLFHKQGT